MTPILEHSFNNLTSWSFKPVPFQPRNCSVQWTAAKECLVKAYITTEIGSKTPLLSRSDKGQDFAWNRQQTEWNIVHKLSPSYLQKPVYGSMPLEPAETRHRSNFPQSRVAFQGTISKAKRRRNVFMAGTEYFCETRSSTTRSHTCQHHAEITQSDTFAVLIWLSITTHYLLTFNKSEMSSNNSSSASPIRRCADHISQVSMKEISRKCSNCRTHVCETN